MKTLTLLALASAVGVTAPTTFAQFTYSEAFTGNTAPGWQFTANGGSAPALTGGSLDPLGQGFLRLQQNNQTDRSAIAYLDNQAFIGPGNALTVQFDFTQWWGGSPAPVGAGEGLTFFLYDSTTVAPAPGGYGGSLGYAQSNAQPSTGLAGAWLGVAFDRTGNFSVAADGRVGGTGAAPDSVGVRGSASTSYAFGTSTAAGAPLGFPLNSTRPDQQGGDYRQAIITLSNDNKLTVSMVAGFGNAPTVLINAYDLTSIVGARPNEFKIGFGSGSSTVVGNTEVRNLSVQSALSAPLIPEPTTYAFVVLAAAALPLVNRAVKRARASQA